MDRKSGIALALVALLVSGSFAQDVNLNLTDLTSQVQRRFSGSKFQQSRVDRIPTSYFADEVTQTIGAEQPSSDQNLLILCSFATLLAVGGVITAISIAKRRKYARRINAAPPVKLCI